MNERFDHLAFSSFYMWLDNYLVVKGGAWQNKTGEFYGYSDPKVGTVYGSSYPQFVYDSDAIGANIISGAYVDSTFVGRGTSGMKIDYKHGRVFSSNASPITGSFAIKEFSLYKNNEALDILIEKAFNAHKETYSKPKSYINPQNLVAPFINVVPIRSLNKPYAYGGEDETRLQIRLTVLTDSSFKLDGVLGLLRDSQYVCLPYINNSQGIPFTYYNDLKNNTFSYSSDIAATYSDKLFIDKVTSTKISETLNDNSDLFYLGYAEFDIVGYRFPRQ